MSIKVAIIAALEAEPDQIMRGRTLLQKKLYFTAALTKEDFGFGPHYYGPYSTVVSAELGALQAAGFVEERAEPLGAINEFGEVHRNDYSFGDGYTLFLTRHPEEAAQYRTVLQRVNDGQISQSARLLSIAAKVHLILSDHGGATTDEIRQEAGALGWHLSTGDIRRVEQYLQQLQAGIPAMPVKREDLA